MDGIVIGNAQPAHLRAIPAIELAAATIFPEADLPQRIRHRVTAAEDLQHALDGGRLWTAVTSEGDIVGFAMADVVDGEAYLVEVDVTPEYGRRGIGSHLVSAVISWAREGGFKALRLITFSHIPWNAAFYEKLGFSVIDRPEPGTELAGLMEVERRAGIDISRRVAMLLPL
jgi:GNAT superfamily N-acetyltransferase